MTNDKNSPIKHNRSTDETAPDVRREFNEMSELSLEERMRVADQLGVPAANTEEENFTMANESLTDDEEDNELPDR